MSTRKRKLHARRTWLNRSARMRAHIIGHVTLETWTNRNGETGQSIDAGISISDCDRVVSLEFGLYGDDNTGELREKVLRLRRSVGDFCDAMDKALDLLDGGAA